MEARWKICLYSILNLYLKYNDKFTRCNFLAQNYGGLGSKEGYIQKLTLCSGNKQNTSCGSKLVIEVTAIKRIE